MISTEASWWNILNLKIYTTLGYIVSLIPLNLGHVINVINYCLTRWTFFSQTHTYGWQCESETRVPSSRGLVKQYNQELCISSNK